MSNTMLLYVGVFVFGLMLVGLILTIIEFRHGEPHQQDEQVKAEKPDETLIPADDRC